MNFKFTALNHSANSLLILDLIIINVAKKIHNILFFSLLLLCKYMLFNDKHCKLKKKNNNITLTFKIPYIFFFLFCMWYILYYNNFLLCCCKVQYLVDILIKAKALVLNRNYISTQRTQHSALLSLCEWVLQEDTLHCIKKKQCNKL